MEDMPIGSVIARARQRKRLKQSELAELLGVHTLTVTSWESGKNFPKRNLGAIEDVLDIDLSAYRPSTEAAQ